ncbi:hypothetical protein [Methylocapsa aurea]|uniref:hypothetical protein n=1 Tax=Methylocapsa aurea TaxID=663610 RepID=UPI0012EC97C9|nr:hypothetical protein [Methylocapsa aurea]
MSIATPDRRKMFRAVLFLISGVLAVFALGISARAAGTRILIIPPDDGYGFQECLASKSACGLVVADAWCEAHGLKASKSFGPADASGTAMDEERPANIKPGSFLVACGDAVN